MKKNSLDKNQIVDKKIDFTMLITIIILLCMGLVMVASASSYYALSYYGDSNYFLTRQLILGLAGVVFMLIISKIDYRIYKRWSYILFIAAFVLLLAVLIPGIGQQRNGATRWLGFRCFSISTIRNNENSTCFRNINLYFT